MTKNIFSFSILLTLTLLLFNCNIKAQQAQNAKNIYKVELENDTWITDKILGLDPSQERYNLTKFIERKFAGNLTYFTDKVSFTSKYVAPCGNDYFTTVIGKYEFIAKNKISIRVDSITYSGDWEKPTEYRKPNDLVYSISKVGSTIILTKEN